MTIKSIHYIGAAVLATLLCGAWAAQGDAPRDEGPSGQVISQVRQPGQFHGVEVTVPAQVEVIVGGTESVRIEGDAKVLPLIETVVENGVLTIRPVKRNMRLRTGKLTVVVEARAIDNLGVAGSATMSAKGIRADNLTLEVAGSGTMDITRIEAKTVNASVAGSGNIEAAGRTQHAKVSVAGSGHADTSRLQAQQATANIAGSGQIEMAAQQALTVSIAGSGDVGYYGDAQVTKSVMGSGSVRRLGGAR
ncbi:putative autotransporter adhesin-like protein [Pseudoduganella lurida]|uniref:Putative autotransporter adhesin-like protein n=1 Tax=Pseudoduganella lurida TaxID=1036180 RepID=A0A562RP04_9BURK|nr:head GIN domain-containing protein [Pseudoduganella lurida]TWI70100.1 putative autotransporter adhesin-like protein [Pseudoduganella lurida]